MNARPMRDVYIPFLLVNWGYQFVYICKMVKNVKSKE